MMIIKKLDLDCFQVEIENKKSAFQIMLYSAFLVPVSMLPWASEMTGTLVYVVAVLISLIMYYPSIKLIFYFR
jgi:heme O synthase-like polyprenyltransferase